MDSSLPDNFFNDENSTDQFPSSTSQQLNTSSSQAQLSMNAQLATNLELLRSMGFSDDDEIRQALTIAKNDINEAVAILTNEKLPKISTLVGGKSSDMSGTNATTSTNTGGNEVVMNSDSNSDSPSSNDMNNNGGSKETNSNEAFKSTTDSTNPLIFPYECLSLLESSVFTDNWSIPYKKDEWLDRLLTSTIAHIKEGTADSDQNCRRFLEKVLPEVYRKLLDTAPVNRWNNEIQTGVMNMTMLGVELIAARLEQLAPLHIVPDVLLETINLIFSPHCVFHTKNSTRQWDNHFYLDAINGAQNLFTKELDSYGWLLNLINDFGLNKGFESIKTHMENTSDLNELNLLLKPISTCVRYLNPVIFKPMLEGILRKIIELISSLANDDFKDKNIGRVFDLLVTVKKIAIELFTNDIEAFHKLHLDTVVNMLKYSHFNSKMNSLKEICKLIEAAKNDHCPSIISDRYLAEWIVNNQILSLAVEGNIDQSQYCEKIKTIVEFIGDRITNQEISALWNMQFNKSLSIVENLYIIIGIAATKFNPEHEQLDFLIGQIIQTWNDSNFKLHDKLVGLLRIIGRDSRSNKTYTRILEALWELKNRPGLSRPLLLLIFSEHLNVLNGGRMPRDQAKSAYIKRCCEDMKRAPGTTISIAALRYIYDILNSYQKNTSKQLKEIVSEIVQPLMKQFCTSLSKCHANAVEKARQLGIPFDQNVLVDDIFTHEEVVRFHLLVLKFLLTEGNLYLNLNRACEIWDILITNEAACTWDRQTGFEWFIESWVDLKDESKADIFKNQILTLKPSHLTLRGYECFRLYFLRVNEFEQRVQCRFNADPDNYHVEKLDLCGLNYLWDIILQVEDEQLAELATKFLLDISYEKVSHKIKRELVQLHQRFINECYNRLENFLIALDTNPISNLLLSGFRIAALSTGMSDMAFAPLAPRALIFKCIARLLMIAEKYIVTVEEGLAFSRTCLPHYLSFRGESFFLNLIVSHSNDTTKTTHLEIPVCSNETLGELRLRIASQLNVLPSSVLIYGPPEQNPSSSTNNKDNSCIFISSTNTTNNNNNNNNNGSSTKLLNQADYKLLSSLNIDGMHPIHVKLASTYPPTTSSSTTQKTFTDFYSSVRIDSEHEKTLPSVLIANNSFAFDMFTRLDDLEQTEIRTRVRNILRLIPTNPKLVEAFDLVVLKRCETSTASVAAAATPTLVKSPSTSSMNIPPSQPILSQTTTASSQSNPCTPTISTLGSSNFLLNNPFLSRSRNAASAASEKPVQISLKEYFEKSQVPLNRILYNLEALSGRLMPPHSVSSDHSKADSFQQDFLQANGLKVLISLLNLESSGKIEVNSDEYETKEDIYLLLLQLLHLLIFGSYYPFNQSHVHTSHNKRPSSEPISCCSSAPKKTVTQSMMDDHLMQQQQQQQPQSPSPLVTAFTPPNFSGSLPHTSLNTTFALATTLNEPTNLVEKMSLNEINELVAQLLTLFWSAAAGNIQLSSSSTKTMSGSTATLTDEIITSGSAVDMQLSSCSLTTATSSQQTTTEETINPVKASASEDMVIVHDMDAMLDDINVADEFPKVGLIDANFNQSLTSARKEVKFFLPEHNRLSTGSNMSTGSLESSSNTASTVNQFSPQHVPHSRADSGDTSILQPGCCIRQKKETKVKDIKIAAKAIEIISCFVQYRKDCLPGLMSMKLFNECILDTLTGSISSEIRTHMERFLLKLVQTDPSVKTQLMQVIIRARLPLWLNTTLTRSSNQRLIAQSTQYFQLRCSLMENLSLDEQSAYGIDLSKMINDELNWLAHFAPTKSLKHIDSVLLTGHLCLLKSLLTCATAPKADVGDECVNQLIRIYLFPASYTLSFGLGNTNAVDEVNMEPVCSSEESRQAAYRLLVELSRNCLKNYRTICHQLIRLHHTYNQALASSEWNIVPPQVTPRADCGFVGLKNGGATCYMNAVLQQINAIPGLNDYVLSVNDEDEPNEIMSSEAAVSNKEDKSMATSDSNNEIATSTDNTANRVVNKQGDRASSVYWQLQNVFAHLKESKLEYYVPEPFWKAFRMLAGGQEINLREQQDAFDFFISLTDQIDEHLKKMKREPIFKNIFEGTFSNQLICTDCPHRYEREEVFLSLNLPIKSGNLQESLLQFFKDELLDGDNAYNCEKCNDKRSAIKRTCIKKLPKYLCIQLKRFDYDWESNRALKFDDYFQFPRSLNVAPYTYDSINSKTGTTTTTDQPTDKSASSSASSSNEQQQKEIMYDLVGIIVHSGQANAGHYYSYIKTSSYQSSTSSKRAVRSRRRCGGSGTEAATAGDECGLPMPLGDDYGPFNAEHEELLQLEQLNQSIDENLYANMCNQVRLAKEEKWFKFNDTAVEEINLTDQVLTEECFGGTFTASSEFKMLPEERIRYWNGYMLFYRESNYSLTLNREEQSRRQQQVNKFKSQRREGSNTNTALSNTDSLSQLAELISKGDEKGIFRRMGFVPEIEQIVKAENLEFCRNRAIYEPNYLNFIFNMSQVFKELDLLGENRYHDSEMFAFEATNLSLEFLYNTYFKIGKKLRTDLNKWLDLLKDLLFYSKESAQCMLNFVVMRESNSSFIRHYLLECPILEIREACQQLFEHCLTSLVVKYEFQPLDSPKIASLITSLVQLLDKAVIDLSKNSHEYFKLLYVYANMSKSTAQQLISLSIFNKLFCFLLGNPAPVKSEESSNNRRWSSQQMKEFGIVHELIATLVLQCNILSRRTCEMDEPMTPTSASEINTPVPTPMSTEVTENDQLKRLDEIAEPETSTSLLASRLGFVDSTAKSSGEKSTRLFFSPPSASDDLIPIPQEMQIYLFGALSSRYLKELVFAFEQINQSSLSKSLQMIQSCCFCNESFSASIIHQILLSINTLSSNDTKQALYLLNSIILIEDPLQLKRLQLTLDGYKDENTVYNGLLTIVRQNQSSDAKKSYHCVKFIVTLANQSSPCREYLLKTATNWEWSVNWLRQKMTESISGYMNWNQSKFHSNEDAEIRTFQRTKSAQRTLDDATALLRSTDIDI